MARRVSNWVKLRSVNAPRDFRGLIARRMSMNVRPSLVRTAVPVLMRKINSFVIVRLHGKGHYVNLTLMSVISKSHRAKTLLPASTLLEITGN